MQELSQKEKQLCITHMQSVHGERAGTPCSLPGVEDSDAVGLHETCCPRMQGGTNTADSFSLLTDDAGKEKEVKRWRPR